MKRLKKQENLFHNIPFQLWYLKNPKTYLKANKEHADFLGVSTDRLAEKDIDHLFNDKIAKKYINDNKKVFNQQRKIITEQWMENYCGEKRLLKIIRYPKFNHDNEIDFVICTAEDLTEEYINKKQKDMQEKIIYSSMEFTEELLTNNNLQEALSTGMELLGKAIGVDRVYYWENYYEETSKQWLTSQKLEWISKDTKLEIQKSKLQDVPFSKIKSFIKVLSKNKVFNELVKNIEEKEKIRKYLESKGILSILTIPVFMKNQFKGFIGFDYFGFEKEWTELEISLLTSFVLLYEKALERNKMKNQIIQAKDNFSNFFNMTQDLLFVIDYEGKIIQTNNSTLEKLNYSREELLGESILKIYSEENQKKVMKNLDYVIKNENKFIDLEVNTKEGQKIPVETEFSKGLWDGQEVVFAVLKNITELRLSEDKFAKAFSNEGLAKFISKYDDGEFVEVNDQFEEFLGYTRNELARKTTLELKMTNDYHDRDFIKKMIREEGKVKDLEINFIQKDGNIRVGLTNIVSFETNNQKYLLSSIIDITERIEYEKKLLEISNRDNLTKLYNRRYLYRKVKEKIEKYMLLGNYFSIIIIDIDDFKKVNDQYGHLAGDYVLAEFSKLLNDNLESDNILGRFGGEEFIILMDDKNKMESKKVLEKILAIVKNTNFKYKDKQIELSFSAGISFIKELKKDRITIDRLIGLADKRMYLAKNTEKGKVVYKEND